MSGSRAVGPVVGGGCREFAVVRGGPGGPRRVRGVGQAVGAMLVPDGSAGLSRGCHLPRPGRRARRGRRRSRPGRQASHTGPRFARRFQIPHAGVDGPGGRGDRGGQGGVDPVHLVPGQLDRRQRRASRLFTPDDLTGDLTGDRAGEPGRDWDRKGRGCGHPPVVPATPPPPLTLRSPRRQPRSSRAVSRAINHVVVLAVRSASRRARGPLLGGNRVVKNQPSGGGDDAQSLSPPPS